ncbi:acyl-ACP desaturase [Paenibacillus sp. FSL H7-0331]|uniref:acyl-ACP desaturase n=1 Tax=Paenibacillus sp. FSL H7-0331 TaxID=1920421 RepID=UPI00096E31DB|nr:acyl-ACP desaturase [Paenibacillus sp. FSL H7-0331]OMF14804.1 acyl-ACP desaturase [Paenibacillus sp. FSL H7-0331]
MPLENYKLDVFSPKLEPYLTELYALHRKRASEIDWSYHEFIPWELGRSFITEPWSIEQRKLPLPIYLAVETSLLTEVNLPFFYHHLATTFKGSLKVLQDFVHTWVSEEDQHSNLLETYLIITRNADPHELHQLRKTVVEGGFVPDFDTAMETMVYTAIQELATMVFYNNVAKAAGPHDPYLAKLLRRIAKDETLHFAFYRDAVKGYLGVDHNFVYYIHKAMTSFAMPGTSMPSFKERMDVIAKEANYGPVSYFNQVFDYLIQFWAIAKLQPSRADAENAKQDLLQYHVKLQRISQRLAAKGIS